MKKWMLLLLAGLGVALAGFYFAGGLFGCSAAARQGLI